MQDYLAELTGAIDVRASSLNVMPPLVTGTPWAWPMQAQTNDFATPVFDGQVLADLLHKPYVGLHAPEL